VKQWHFVFIIKLLWQYIFKLVSKLFWTNETVKVVNTCNVSGSYSGEYANVSFLGCFLETTRRYIPETWHLMNMYFVWQIFSYLSEWLRIMVILWVKRFRKQNSRRYVTLALRTCAVQGRRETGGETENTAKMCLLVYTAVWSCWSRLTFQTCVLPSSLLLLIFIWLKTQNFRPVANIK
jgi:hypothetical protein